MMTVMKRRLGFWCLAVALVAALESTAQEQDAAAKSPLFTGDRQAVLDYLKGHRIPSVQFNFPRVLTVAPPPDPFPKAREEVERAAELFIAGDTETRLAIAQAVDAFFGSARRMWDACTGQDYEARHYLLPGMVCEYVDADVAEGLQWLLDHGHPGFAQPILRSLCEGYGTEMGRLSAQDRTRLLALLRRVYREPGTIVCFPPDPEYKTEVPGVSGSIQRFTVNVVGRLHTNEALEQIVSWMIADGKKSDADTQREMWTAFWGARELGPPAQLKTWAANSELAELWLITTPQKEVDPRWHDFSWNGMAALAGTRARGGDTWEIFAAAVVQQLGNPDAQVCKGLGRYYCDQFATPDAGLPYSERPAILLRLTRAMKLTETACKRFVQAFDAEAKTHDWAGPPEAVEAYRKAVLEAVGAEVTPPP